MRFNSFRSFASSAFASCAVALLIVNPVRAQDSGARAVKAPRAEPRSGNYTLTQSDVVAIRVFREPDLDSQCRISKDGTINFPLLGVVAVAGKTTNEASSYLAALLDKDYLVRPQVTVSIVDFAKKEYTVMGRVERPGSFSIDEDGVTIYQAIAAAGGFTRLANESRVIVLRGDETIRLDCSQNSKDPTVKSFRVRVKDTIKVEERFF
jgi:protein involved in polysaccharide export with SLBB domain